MASDHQHWQIGNKGKEVTVWKSHKNWLGSKLPGQILVISGYSQLWIISVKIIVASAPISLLGTRTMSLFHGTMALISGNTYYREWVFCVKYYLSVEILDMICIVGDLLHVEVNFLSQKISCIRSKVHALKGWAQWP